MSGLYRCSFVPTSVLVSNHPVDYWSILVHTFSCSIKFTSSIANVFNHVSKGKPFWRAILFIFSFCLIESHVTPVRRLLWGSGLRFCIFNLLPYFLINLYLFTIKLIVWFYVGSDDLVVKVKLMRVGGNHSCQVCQNL